ncbi:MAG: hypothetical protein MUF54_06305 [Polyangiaceae bacterium]|nr:hypothetical protein [Polyangiaceae bacterium]
MTRPRCIVPGGTFFVSRRTCRGMFRLHPGSRTNRILLYCLAYAAERTGVQIHAYIAMSSYHHIIGTDPLGKLPVFLHLLHMLTAKALNASQGQWENLWAPEHTCVVRLAEVQDILGKIAYVGADSVNAGLVRHPDDWPGVILWRPGTRVIATRPEVFFRSVAPGEIELRIVQPAGAHYEPQQWNEMVHAAVAQEVRSARASVEATGLPFLGRDRVLKASFLAKAKLYEQKRGINPLLAAKDITKRRAFLIAQKLFRAAYRVALDAWRAGNRSAVFPFGTWWMRVHHGAAVATGLA